MQPTNIGAAIAPATPLSGASSDSPTQQTVPAGAPGPADASVGSAASAALSAVKVSISTAAQAYLSQPDPPSIAEIQRAKKKPKMKSLLEHMLEWSRKYEAQRDQQQKDKQLADSQGKHQGDSALTTNGAESTRRIKQALPGADT